MNKNCKERSSENFDYKAVPHLFYLILATSEGAPGSDNFFKKYIFETRASDE